MAVLWIPLRPPQCSVSESRGVGQKVIRGRECSSKSCREAGGRVTVNKMGDIDLRLPHAHDSRLEIVADGLPLFGGMQLAVDTTFVYPLHCGVQPDPVPHRLIEPF